MRRNSLSRQVGLIIAGASLLFGVIVGFWPVSVTVVGDVSYSCGSGFMHSRSAWKADTRLMGEPQQAVGLSTATPNASCPSRVYRHRDIGYALIAIAVMAYAALLATAAFDPGATPVTRAPPTRSVRASPLTRIRRRRRPSVRTDIVGA